MSRFAIVYLAVLSAIASAQPMDPCLSQRFHPDFEPRSLEFGVEVAINDEHLIVVDRFSGAFVYTYRKDAATGEWVLNQRVPGGSGGDAKLVGNRFITGDARVPPAGGARIYEFDGERWIEIAELAAGPGRDSPWGEHVALADGHAAVGNADEDVLIFREVGGEWAFVEEIVSPDSEFERSDFGDALAMDERFLIVGAPGEDITGNQNGAIYIYEWGPDGRPLLMQKLIPDPVPSGPRLGTSLALQGGVLVAGARIFDISGVENAGTAFVYTLSGGEWVRDQQLFPSSPTPQIGFGWDVSLNDDVIVGGAITQFSGGDGRGTAHLFRKGFGGEWLHQTTVTLYGVIGQDYSESVDLGGGQLVVGGSEVGHMGEDQGVADVYDLGCLLCAPDLDADGTLTIFDFLLFFNAFDAGDPIADFDGDGELTIFDFLAFQTAFDAGCA